MRHILYISGTRADFGLMRHTLRAIHAHPQLHLSVAATGMHLMADHGMTIDELRAEEFDLHELPVIFEGDDRAAMAHFIGELLIQLTALCRQIKPDIILLLGDRGEMLAGATVATYMGIPAAHIHGGEVTSTVDEAARHAITKLSHLHFPATAESRERILRLGEDPNHVWVSGGPGLDGITEGLLPEKELRAQYGLSPTGTFALVVQHPVSEELEQADTQMRATLEAVQTAGLEAIVAYPNADAGGRKMIEVIEEFRINSSFSIHQHIPRDAYLGLMKYASVMVGNSSSGIIEAASFHTPVINIGTRQEGRQRAANVLDATYDAQAIGDAVHTALHDTQFLSKLPSCTNPYGDGRAAERIVHHLSEVAIGPSLLQKQMTY